NGVQQLPQTQVGKTTFYKDDENPPTPTQKMAVKQLLGIASIAYEPNQEGSSIPALIQHLKELAGQCGGDAPLPGAPDTSHLDAFLHQSGNARFRAVADDHPRLKADLEAWQATANRRAEREGD